MRPNGPDPFTFADLGCYADGIPVTIYSDEHGSLVAHCDSCYQPGSGAVEGGDDHGVCDRCGRGA